jgi:hypothetical protein
MTVSFETLDFSIGQSTRTILLNIYFAIRTVSLMTTSWTLMAALECFFAWHATSGNWIRTCFPKILITC